MHKSIEEVNTSNKEILLNCVEKMLHSIYKTVSAFRTQQEIADAIKVLTEAADQINKPAVDLSCLMPPSINTNRKGRKSNKKGVKSGTERMKILQEIFEESQKKQMKKRAREEKEEEELEKKKRLLDIEERYVALEQVKRKLTLVVLGPDGKVSSQTSSSQSKDVSIKVEQDSSSYNRYTYQIKCIFNNDKS